MSAVRLWTRSVLRQHRWATLFLVVLIGLPAGVVLAAFESNQRAAGSLDRFLARANTWDASMEVCPPEIAISEADDAPMLRRKCYNLPNGERLVKLLADMPVVEAAALADPFPYTVLDPKAPNGVGWRMNGVYAFRTPGVPIALDPGTLRSGRWPRDDAPDEIAINERMQNDLHLRIGDTIMIVGWDPESIDRHSQLRPNTEPFPSTVVGVVRTVGDIVQFEQLGPLEADNASLGVFLAGSGWARAHLDSLGRWSTSGVVRLRGGQTDLGALQEAIDKIGWRGGVSTPIGDRRPIVERVIADERNATAAFAWLGLGATATLGLLVVRRQLRHELGSRATLQALGFDDRMAVAAATIRALTIIVPSVALALAVGVAGSSLTPFGTAGRIDSGGLRFSRSLSALLAFTIALTVVVAALSAAARPIRRHVSSRRRLRPSAGPSTLVGAALTRGSAPVVATVSTAVAVAALIGGSVAVASFDQARATPRIYGSWSDAGVSLWQTIGKPAEHAAQIRKAERLRGVRAVTIVRNPYGQGRIGNTSIAVFSLTHRQGPPPKLPIREGRSVTAPDEIMLDIRSARATRKRPGDIVTFNLDAKSYALRVVGIAYPFNAACGCDALGTAVVHRSLITELASDQIELGFDDSVTREEIIDQMRSSFGSYAAVPIPPISLSHVGAVRMVPRLIAVLIGALAFATLLHALVTLLRRHRRDFAVLSVLGFERRHHRATRTWAALLLTGSGTAIGIPVGIVLGRRLWRVYTDRLTILPDTRLPPSALVAAPLLAIVFALIVGVLSGRTASARISFAESLHSE